jgi:SNF2 family DNA or RNA helicase
MTSLPFPTKTEPWPHQVEAYYAMADRPASLYYGGMGVGKTATAIHLIQGWGSRLTLVVCPKSVIPAWRKQIEMHGPDCWYVVTPNKGTTAQKAQAIEGIMRSPVYYYVIVLNYEAVWRGDLGKIIKKYAHNIDLVIADEIHRIKSPSSKVSWFMTALGKKVHRKLGLSGTPLAHSPLDAYAEFRFLDPSIFGKSAALFRARYAVMNPYVDFPQVLSYQNKAEFRDKFFSITHQVHRDVLDLPPVMHEERTFALEGAAKKHYLNLKEHFMTEHEGGLVTAANALTKVLRLQQLTGGWLKLDGNEYLTAIHYEKQNLLGDLLQDLGGEPVVVFCLYKTDLQATHIACGNLKIKSAELSGSHHQLEEWQEGEAQVLAVQVQSGSEGIDLTRAAYAVFFSLGWSLAKYEQALARLSRPGQKRPVMYYHLIAEDTVDRQVYQALRDRKDVIEDILEGGLR